MKCPACKRDISRVALVNLVFTWEPVDDELIETGWHKDCYLSAQQNVQREKRVALYQTNVSGAVKAVNA